MARVGGCRLVDCTILPGRLNAQVFSLYATRTRGFLARRLRASSSTGGGFFLLEFISCFLELFSPLEAFFRTLTLSFLVLGRREKDRDLEKTRSDVYDARKSSLVLESLKSLSDSCPENNEPKRCLADGDKFPTRLGPPAIPAETP